MKTFKNIPFGYKLVKGSLIPENWEIKEIAQFASLASGGTPKRENTDYWNGNIPWVTTTLITGKTIHEAEEYISDIGLNNSSTKLFPKDTILMAMYGQGQTRGRVSKLGIQAATNQACAAIIPDTTVEVDYLLEYLLLNYKNIRKLSNTGNQENLSLQLIKAIKVKVPPIHEQRKIATILNTWDEAIQKCEQTILSLLRRNKGLAQQLLLGKNRLKGFEDDWKKYHFSDIIKKVKRPVQWSDDELYNLISVRRRSGGIFYREALHGHQIKVKNLHTAKAGDFLFSKMQIVHGASALVTDEFDEAKISGSYISVRAKDESILSMEFLNWYSKLPKFYHQTFISSYGVHIEKMTFDFELFLTETIQLPSKEEQKTIVTVLADADKELKLHQQQIATLTEQKKGLISLPQSGSPFSPRTAK